MRELQEDDPETFLGLRLDDLLADLEEPEAQSEDEEPEEFPEPFVQPGEMWLLGEHLLLCGDATEAPALERLMAGARARMAFTDPPYNVDYEGKAGKIANDALGDGFGAFLESAIRNILEHTDGATYICMSSSELDVLQAAFRRAGGHWSTFLIWAKSSFTIGRSDYQRQYEPILYGWRKGAKRYWRGDRDQGDVWECDKPSSSRLHPTTKPVDLVARAIRNSSEAGDIVLDPFSGSGSTLIGCEASGRHCRAMELDPKFCDVIIRRWERYSGGKAHLVPA